MSNHFNTPTTVANPNKPYGVSKILFKNQQSLISFLENFDVSNHWWELNNGTDTRTHTFLRLLDHIWPIVYSGKDARMSWLSFKDQRFRKWKRQPKNGQICSGIWAPVRAPPHFLFCVCAWWCWCCSIHMNQSLLITPCIFYSSTQMIMYISVINALWNMQTSQSNLFSSWRDAPRTKPSKTRNAF